VRARCKDGTITKREIIKEINKMAKPEAKKKRRGKSYNIFLVKFLTKRRRRKKD